MSLTGRRKYYEELINHIRTRQKERKEEFGFIPLNDWFDGSEAHHLDKEHVLYVPSEIHKHRHSQKNQESMDKINEVVIDWYVQYYGLV